jgi:hypothetical protein
VSDERIRSEDELLEAGRDAAEPEGYKAWFERELEAGLKEANDPSTKWITAEESDERMRLLRVARDSHAFEKAS